jgi:hypothetical protein
MLGSHPEVFAAGELQAFSVVVTQLAQRRGGTIRSQRDLIDRSLDIDPVELGAKYLEATRPRTGHTARFVDKMPTNYLNVLLIHRALPKARIVAVRRSPVDSCYAMYKSFLTGPYRFTNDLGDIARYYAAWCHLMDHWDSLLGSALLRVRYEDVVTDTERVARRLLDYCGLPWSRRCLAFHESAAAVATASASQVRRPIYASSIGKWRAYRTELQPLLSALRAEGIVIED